MFENITQILPILYLKDRQNNEFLEELFKEDVIPIGVVLKDIKSYYQNKETHEDILPCIIYKENYRA